MTATDETDLAAMWNGFNEDNPHLSLLILADRYEEASLPAHALACREAVRRGWMPTCELLPRDVPRCWEWDMALGSAFKLYHLPRPIFNRLECCYPNRAGRMGAYLDDHGRLPRPHPCRR